MADKNKQYDIAIIGSAGFLVENLLSHLLIKNKNILLIGEKKPALTSKNISYIYLNLLDDNIDVISNKYYVDTVIHNAVLKGRFEKGTNQWNQQGKISAPDFSFLFQKLNLVVQRLITIGSSEEYGPRDTDDIIYEDDPVNPITSYGYWKTILHQNGLRWAGKNNYIHLRPFILFGIGQDNNMFLNQIITTLLSGNEFNMTKGEQWRDFVHIDVLCTIINNLLDMNEWRFNSLNIAGNQYFRIVDVANIIYKEINKGKLNIGALEYREFEVWHQKASTERLKIMFPNIIFRPFNEDVRTLIDYYKQGTGD